MWKYPKKQDKNKLFIGWSQTHFGDFLLNETESESDDQPAHSYGRTGKHHIFLFDSI